MLHRNNPDLMKNHELYYNGNAKFHHHPKIEKMAEWMFLYKNFLDQDTFEKYNNILKNIPEEDWHDPEFVGKFWENKVSPEVIKSDLHTPISHLIAPNFWLFKNTSFVRLNKGERTDIHTSDRYFADNNQRIISHYKIALYFGEFEGGEICFPDQHIKYKPEPNDLLLFKIHQHYNHYTDTVTEGTRYAYQDFAIYTPDYFMP